MLEHAASAAHCGNGFIRLNASLLSSPSVGFSLGCRSACVLSGALDATAPVSSLITGGGLQPDLRETRGAYLRHLGSNPELTLPATQWTCHWPLQRDLTPIKTFVIVYVSFSDLRRLQALLPLSIKSLLCCCSCPLSSYSRLFVIMAYLTRIGLFGNWSSFSHFT